MNRRQKIIISVTGIFLVLLILVGLTYAYFLTQIEGNPNTKSISVTTANLALTYGDGTTALLTSSEPIIPGEFTASKDFTVTNNGNATVENYGVVIEDFSVKYANTTDEVTKDDKTYLEFPEDMKMTLTCKNSDGTNCNGITDGTLPTTNDILVTNTIEKDETQTYTLTLTYVDNGDQSADMNKTIEGKINIIDTHSTVDLTGTVSNYEAGDYVQTNSTPRVSSIDKNGNYKVVGLEPGTHTVKVLSKTGAEKGSKEINIVKGEEASVSGNTITITDESRSFDININATSKEYTVGSSVFKYNPYKEGTLAYNILDNALNITEEEKTLGYAEYRMKPLTKPAIETTMIYTGYENPTTYSLTGVTSTNYYIYSNQIKIDSITGKFTLVNPQKGLYSEVYNTLNDGMYMVGLAGYNESMANNYAQKGQTFDTIYKVGEQTSSSSLYYGTVIKNTVGIENSLSMSTDELGTTYYYRGGVTNNYVNFNNMCWRIVRIEGDGSIKLILEDQFDTCEQIETDTDNDGYTYTGNWNVGDKVYGYTKNSYGKYIANYESYSGGIKDTLNEWLINSISEENQNKLKSTTICIEDWNSPYDSTVGLPLPSEEQQNIINSSDASKTYYYKSLVRLKGVGQAQNATYMCDANGKSENEYKVYPLTADEIVFAGGKSDTLNNHYYLLNEYQKNNNKGWLSSSISYFVGKRDSCFSVQPDGRVFSANYVNSSSGNRPSISILKSRAIYSDGNGTQSDPYVIE